MLYSKSPVTEIMNMPTEIIENNSSKMLAINGVFFGDIYRPEKTNNIPIIVEPIKWVDQSGIPFM